MYYVINDIDNPSINEDEDDAPFLEIHEELLTNPRQGWHSGKTLLVPPLEPIEIEATPHFGYQGPPQDYYDDSISLMSPKLVELLKREGIYNIDFYPVLITYRTTNEKYDWYAFNIIGLIEAVDVHNSNIQNIDGDSSINSTIRGFKVDETKTNQLLIFRLKENVMTTLVHKVLKNIIEKADINTFGFTKTEDYYII